jgi:hypothetical protein
MRSNNIPFLISLLLIGSRLTDGKPLIPLPFLRGGSTKLATKKSTKQQRRQRKHPGVNPIQLVAGGAKNAKQGLDKVGNKLQRDTSALGKNLGHEFGRLNRSTRRFAAAIPKILPKPGKRRRRRKALKKSSKLDEACSAFASVRSRSGNELDTAALLKACRAHLAVMKLGGSSLRLVAKDLESNVQKAERVYKKSSNKDGRHVSSLLEAEKNDGVHNGNELQEKSAAMGLLWIRRSLAFQLDLYASLMGDTVHPRDAAYAAYIKHLSPFHGWALRKVFPASLSQMPNREVFIAKFGGIGLEELNDEYDRAIAKKLKTLINTWDPLIREWEADFARLDLEDTRRV